MEELNKFHLDLSDKSKEYQVRYVYYVVALCTSAIGYAVYRTTGHSFSPILILLLLALVCLGLSIHIGLLFLRKTIYTIDTEMKFVQLQKGLENNPDSDGKKILTKMSVDTEFQLWKNQLMERGYLIWQSRLFLYGIILFVIWHLTEMYLIASK